MDRFICQCDALGDVEVRTIVRGLKKKFASELGHVSQQLCVSHDYSGTYYRAMKSSLAVEGGVVGSQAMADRSPLSRWPSAATLWNAAFWPWTTWKMTISSKAWR